MFDTWTNETAVAQITNRMEAGCDHLDGDSKETCDNIVNVFVQIPPGIFEGMVDLALPVPRATCALIRKCNVECCAASSPPEQVHLSLASKDKSVMGVTWVTLKDTTSIVQYGLSAESLTSSESGDVSTYTFAGWVGAIHRATMINLTPATTYYYRVGNGEDRWSEVFSFTTYDPSRDTVSFAIIADMAYDTTSDNTVMRIQELVDAGSIDGVIHSGDISYADGYEPHWDDFFNKVQGIAAKVPYMASPGNHEFWANFTSYKHRFFLPGVVDLGASGDNMYYSWEFGPAHFDSLNSETALDTGAFHEDMVAWMDEDMSAIDRTATPWLITHFHRPMYCSNDKDCDMTFAGLLRKQGEQMFHKHKVDIAITGHIHAYERTAPVYLGKVVEDTKVTDRATVYLLQGSSGNREGNKGQYPDDPSAYEDWSKVRLTDVGYAVMTVSPTTLDWKFFNSETNELLDQFSLQRQMKEGNGILYI